jgi:HAD superfamily phosphoserine phosphatase-like hydrolase
MVWKKRTHETSYLAYEKELIQAYHEAIRHISVQAFHRAVQTVFEEYKDQTYTYTRDLIRKLQAQNYLLFAVSASQNEIVKLLAEYYGFDDAGGSVYHQTDGGRFTGTLDLLKREKKPEFIRQLIEKHEATHRGSIAVGDSDGDIPMLSFVEQPIVFNPDKKLFAHARAHHWKIVLERKSMIYELEPYHGSYILAETNG